VDPGNTSCASVKGILYNKDVTVLYACPGAYEGKVEIPSTVTTIARRAFAGCKLIKEIVLPESVTTIEEQAFADCKVLKNLAYVRKHLLREIEYRRMCIDVLEEKPELLKEVLSSGTIPAKDMAALIFRWQASGKADLVALLLQCQKR